MHNDYGSRQRSVSGIVRWTGLGLGIAAFWLLTFVILPQGQRLPLVEPVMKAIADSEIDAGSYWYTQSEETAYGALYVRNVLNSQELRK
jgi:hypothetical protein